MNRIFCEVKALFKPNSASSDLKNISKEKRIPVVVATMAKQAVITIQP
ncbi:hypothetical protein ACFLTP_08350 [Chloroflexota bacterium]